MPPRLRRPAPRPSQRRRSGPKTRPPDEPRVIDEAERKLRAQHNAKSKLCALPTEMLCRIMTFNAWADWDDLDADYMDIIHWTHVCHHLRSVAVSTPQLWTYLPKGITSHLYMLQTMLSRSKNALLEVEMKFMSPEDMGPALTEALEGILLNSSRLRTLALTYSKALFTRRLLVNPAPHLASLDIEYICGWEDEDDVDDDDEEGIHIDYALFGGETPSLRELHLDRCTLPWDSSIFAGLTSLWIVDIPPEIRPEPDVFIAALRTAPNLEALHLWRCLLPSDRMPSLTEKAKDVVKLPRMKHLELNEPHFVAYGHLLQHLDLPIETKIRVLGVGRDDFIPALPHGSPMLPPSLFTIPYSSPSPSKSLVLQRGCNSIQFTMYDRSLEGAEWYDYEVPTEDEQLAAEFDWPNDKVGNEAIVRHVHEYLDLSDIHTLKISGGFPPTVSFWKGLFRNASQLRRLLLGLDVGPRSVSSVFLALKPPRKKSAPAPLPHLAELHISTPEVRLTDPSSVTRVLAARERAGSKLEKLTMKQSKDVSLVEFATQIGAEMVKDSERVSMDGFNMGIDEADELL